MDPLWVPKVNEILEMWDADPAQLHFHDGGAATVHNLLVLLLKANAARAHGPANKKAAARILLGRAALCVWREFTGGQKPGQSLEDLQKVPNVKQIDVRGLRELPVPDPAGSAALIASALHVDEDLCRKFALLEEQRLHGAVPHADIPLAQLAKFLVRKEGWRSKFTFRV